MLHRAIALLSTIVWAATPVSVRAGVPDDLKDFGLVCFCNSRVATPHYPIGLDNNGKLLFAARSGIAREELTAAGIAHNQSQIRLLKDWGLLKEKDKVLTTAFPVLEPDAMASLRARLRPVADRLAPLLRPHAAAIAQELKRRGQSRSAYALLFSYVLDGLVWEELRKSGKLPDQDITVEKPYWAGTFWAVFPKQDQMPGTNGRSSGRGELKMLWTPKVVDQINAFYRSQAAAAWIDALNKHATLPPLFASKEIKPLLVREEPGDLLYANGAAMAKIVAPAMVATDLAAELPHADQSQRLLIGTHELIWMLLDTLVADQKLALPAVLQTGARTNSDLAPLVIGVLNADSPSTP